MHHERKPPEDNRLKPLTGEHLERYFLERDKSISDIELAHGAGYADTEDGLSDFREALYVAGYVRGLAEERHTSFEEAWKLCQPNANARPVDPNPDAEQLVERLRISVKERLEGLVSVYPEQFRTYDGTPIASIEDSCSINISWRGGGFYTVDNSGAVRVNRSKVEPFDFADFYVLPWSISDNEGISRLTDLIAKNILEFVGAEVARDT
jgi:hypothetical protein